ncbi:GHMP family kinase ATP-binding protein [Paenibacillus sp. FSL R7-0331]|uniref:GHMP family kinase ATP-binding protein n=1 Tax=Paenibacillus sp. FSL R7-0331 TaxID=1536773 RepID=UPI0004F904AA|nr:hypothetical protein [Paenibacillus sp. FSL R7-0331]AIQ51301.1 hypothetical protein R70331_07110 [Paenibacillus sp. FSL R7-0331]
MILINNFQPFLAGTVYNPLKVQQDSARPRLRKVTIRYPSRLNAMAIDPSGIVENHNMKYKPGEIIFSVALFIEIEVGLLEQDEIRFDGDTERISVVKHVCQIMKKALGYKGGFDVRMRSAHSYRHCGLGSTGAMQSGIAASINSLFGNPIEAKDLVKYLAQNYGEEIDSNEDYLMPVQCIGGSAASGLYSGGVLVIAGENTVIAHRDIDERYEVILGIPRDFEMTDSKQQFEKEQENLHKFRQSGQTHKHEIAYNVLHHFLPAVYSGDLRTMGDVIYDYRFDKGSIHNCSYTYPGLIELSDNLSYLKREGHVEVLSISSVGPTFFAIAEQADECIRAFEQQHLEVIRTKINNEAFSILDYELYD